MHIWGTLCSSPAPLSNHTELPLSLGFCINPSLDSWPSVTAPVIQPPHRSHTQVSVT